MNKIAVAILAYDHNDIVRDTVDSVKTWMTDRVVVVVDRWGRDRLSDVGAEKVDGFYHHSRRNPHRNYTLGIYKLYSKWPDSDWFVYMDYDCLVVSDFFRNTLEQFPEKIWCAGNDHRIYDYQFTKLSDITGVSPVEAHYLLGCCHFHSRKFIKILNDMNFFDRFLNATINYTDNFPGYDRHSFEEELFPTLAYALGGDIAEFAKWTGEGWTGKGKVFSMRFEPEMNDEIAPCASIVHPVKKMGRVRNYFANSRLITHRHSN